MPKPPKYPGLLPKFERALQDILASEALRGSEIQARLRARAGEFGLTAEELGHLQKNFANYIARAKESELIGSGGPWAGYQLNRVVPPPTVQSGKPTEAEREWRPLEGAMHLVATCALSIQYGSRVASLPKSTDDVAWGNADMLMLRGNPSRQRLENSNLDPEILKLADSSPECILTSIELKHDLQRSRRRWFSAVAEAAANSRWANESLLVHVSPEPQLDAIDDEVISLARSAELGIIEVSAFQRDGHRSLETRVIVAPPHRPFLRLAELSGLRAGLLQEAHKLLHCWNQDIVTFLDEEGAERKLLSLLRQAILNLRRQSGFGDRRPLAESLSALVSAPRVADLFAAALDSAAIGTDVATSFTESQQALTQAGGESLTKKQWDEFSAEVAALRSFIGAS